MLKHHLTDCMSFTWELSAMLWYFACVGCLTDSRTMSHLHGEIWATCAWYAERTHDQIHEFCFVCLSACVAFRLPYSYSALDAKWFTFCLFCMKCYSVPDDCTFASLCINTTRYWFHCMILMLAWNWDKRGRQFFVLLKLSHNYCMLWFSVIAACIRRNENAYQLRLGSCSSIEHKWKKKCVESPRLSCGSKDRKSECVVHQIEFR